jgi:large subunit ribosomal protein L37Ae
LPRTKKVGPTRGFGTRYGATVRKRYIKVIAGLKTKHRCPNCGFMKVTRKSVGVWQCGKCYFTFTGGAYVPSTKLGVVAKRAAKSEVAVAKPVEVAPETEEETQ